MNSGYQVTTPLRAIYDGAKDFGLTDDEVWRTIDESMHQVGGDASITELIDELSAATHRVAGRRADRYLLPGRSAPSTSASRLTVVPPRRQRSAR